MDIRAELPGDAGAIRDLTARAFADQSHSSGTEAAIVERLRAGGDLTISLVAIVDDQIVGHIAFSPVTVDDQAGAWFGLGPISVAPDRQHSGIGSALVREGLSTLKTRDATGCVLIGNPDYYGRFGFISDGALTYGDVPERYVQWLSFDGTQPAGRLRYSPAFD